MSGVTGRQKNIIKTNTEGVCEKDFKFTLSESMRPLSGDSVTPHGYLEKNRKRRKKSQFVIAKCILSIHFTLYITPLKE